MFLILSLLVSLSAQAQLVAVKGTVSTTTGNVRYASVTFIDNSDTTRKIAVICSVERHGRVIDAVCHHRKQELSTAKFRHIQKRQLQLFIGANEHHNICAELTGIDRTCPEHSD
jgi:hypothetical protein